jgi:hypothetical protein
MRRFRIKLHVFLFGGRWHAVVPAAVAQTHTTLAFTVLLIWAFVRKGRKHSSARLAGVLYPRYRDDVTCEHSFLEHRVEKIIFRNSLCAVLTRRMCIGIHPKSVRNPSVLVPGEHSTRKN